MTARFRHWYLQDSVSQLGFTLIELLVVIAIIAILTAMGTVSYGNAQVKSRDARRKSDLKQIQAALELYKADYGHYPCTVNNGPWVASITASNPWIVNDEATCPTGNANAFINYAKTPFKDPINSGSNIYYYGSHQYWNGYGLCPVGQYYVLFTQLENTSDPDRSGATNPTVCGYNYTSLWGTSATNEYILTNP